MDTKSQEYRHQCEVRYLIKRRVKEGRVPIDEYFEGVAKQRGQESLQELMDDVLEQWTLGNRGDDGIWFESKKSKKIKPEKERKAIQPVQVGFW